MDDYESLSHTKWTANTTWSSFPNAAEERSMENCGDLEASRGGNRAAAVYLRRPLRSYRRRERLSPASTDGQGSYPFSWPAARQGRPSFGDYRERSAKCGIGTVRVGPEEQVLQHAAPLRAPAKKR